MASSLFSVGRFFLIEYIYHDVNNPEIINTNNAGFRKISNNYKKIDTFVNKNNSATRTKNVIDDTVIELNDGRFVLLDNDAAFFYPNVDQNIIVEEFNINPSLNVIYDTIRIHFISGYNFPDSDGFVLRVDVRQNDNNPLSLCNSAFLKNDQKNLFFNPIPIRISEFLYDRFVEIKIPSPKYLLDTQINSPGVNTTLTSRFTSGKGIVDAFTAYIDFRIIRSSVEDNAILYLYCDSVERFAIATKDAFEGLVPYVQQATDGDYFIYGANYYGSSFEDFIFSLNSVAGNNFMVFHELKLVEQIGESFIETDNMSSIQVEDFDINKTYVPIIRNQKNAMSFSLDYTLRLFNRGDGRSIFKKATLTSYEINRYGKSRMKLNVGGDQPIKIYNKIVSSENPVIREIGGFTIQTKYVNAYIDTANVIVQVDDESEINNAYKRDNVVIYLYPFDNIIRFNFLKRLDGVLGAFNLGNIDYYITFRKDDNTFLRIKEIADNSYIKSNGEIIFKVPMSSAQELLNMQSKRFYISSINSDDEETALAIGDFLSTNNIAIDPNRIENINSISTSDNQTTIADDTGEIVDNAELTNSPSESLSRIKKNLEAKIKADKEKIRKQNIS